MNFRFYPTDNNTFEQINSQFLFFTKIFSKLKIEFTCQNFIKPTNLILFSSWVDCGLFVPKISKEAACWNKANSHTSLLPPEYGCEREAYTTTIISPVWHAHKWQRATGPPDIHGPTTVVGRVQGRLGIPGHPIRRRFEIRADVATRHFRIIGGCQNGGPLDGAPFLGRCWWK